MNIENLIDEYKKGNLSVEYHIKSTIDKIEADALNAYISVDGDGAINKARELDQKLKNGEKLGKLFGIPVVVKDNISYDQMRMTCASKMLEDFTPIFNATVVENLINEDAIIVAKSNMDEFAMGGRGESSYFGPTKNPLDGSRVPGGSSSGSAVAVAKDDVLISLGTDTGGSVRCPASYCNIIGYKPTYSLMSRSGVVSMANTLDQVSLFAKNIEDIRVLANTTSSPDPKDMTSILEKYDYKFEDYDFKGKKIGYINTYSNLYKGIEDTVGKDYEKALNQLKELGAELEEVKLEYAKYANPVYNVVMSSEVSSNMSRFDGVRFGYQADKYENVEELFVKSRSEGLGEEVQRRIALGTMYLSANDDQKIYKKGLKIRSLIRNELENIFKEYDFIITPTTTNLAPKLGEANDDPLSDFRSDGFNVIVNLAGMCGISLPVRKGLSGSVQLIADRFEDNNLLNASEKFLRSINEN